MQIKYYFKVKCTYNNLYFFLLPIKFVPDHILKKIYLHVIYLIFCEFSQFWKYMPLWVTAEFAGDWVWSVTPAEGAIFAQRNTDGANRGGKVRLECARSVCCCKLILFAEFKWFLCLKVKSKTLLRPETSNDYKIPLITKASQKQSNNLALVYPCYKPYQQL